MTNKRLMAGIFFTCLLQGALLLAIMLAEPVANGAGVPHPAFPGMLMGGDGSARLAMIGAYAFLFQSLLLLLIVLFCLLGINEKDRSPALLGAMLASFLFSLFCWWQMVAGHQAYMETGETGYFLGFPTATAWQVYGTWAGALPLIIIYSLGFRKFILTEAEEETFNELVREVQDKEVP